jgi:metallophosphoesterase (TIGR03768 family)
MRNRTLKLIVSFIISLDLAACGSDNDSVRSIAGAGGSSQAGAGGNADAGGDVTDGGAGAPMITQWPIANEVFTTDQQQILPFALPTDTPQINPVDVAMYAEYGYSAWHRGAGLPYAKRAELAPGYMDAPNAARLLSFFAMSDIHITDKESPGEVIYPGSSAPYGHNYYYLLQQAYSPCMLSTTQVLDAAVQTLNALHKKSPFDFGLSLGDVTNSTQYNELRWYIDVMDGKVITPSSGGHLGADTIDYQKPFQAVGLDKTIPWYQAIGNHDQYWMGMVYEGPKTQQAHVGNTIIDLNFDLSLPDVLNSTGDYQGVIDGSTQYGNVIGAGPEADFSTPPTVIADPDRRSLVTDASSSKNWMSEFLNTTSKPVGHGFTQSNVDNDFASYTFEPRADVPLKVIVLDDTCKKDGTATSARYYGSGCLDQIRLDWLVTELQKGQDEGKLMIIGAHIPIKPQNTPTDNSPSYDFYSKTAEDALLTTLHSYPNFILWLAGHRHLNTVTAQPYNAADLTDHPEQSFWEVETPSLRDFPQQLRTFDIRRNSDNTLSILITNVDPAVAAGTPAERSRGYAIAIGRLYGATPTSLSLTDSTSHAYNAELVKQLSSDMQAKISNYGVSVE